jgi:lysophospholipase L1-like esterase
MKRVILLGDSIRMGYEGVVRAELADAAHVWAPVENGQHSVHLLMNFWGWVVSQQPDVLHLNAGLWDMRRVVRGESEGVVSLDAYRANVARLIRLAKEHTRARIVWATTTPVNAEASERTHRQKGMAGRDAANVARYNAVAVEVARAAGVVVDDLHAVVCGAGQAALQDPDGVHFTSAGYDVLGRAVAACLRVELAR